MVLDDGGAVLLADDPVYVGELGPMGEAARTRAVTVSRQILRSSNGSRMSRMPYFRGPICSGDGAGAKAGVRPP
jgi:hypothetical protein